MFILVQTNAQYYLQVHNISLGEVWKVSQPSHLWGGEFHALLNGARLTHGITSRDQPHSRCNT